MCAQAGARCLVTGGAYLWFTDLKTGRHKFTIDKSKATVASIKDKLAQPERLAEMCAQAGAKYIENRAGEIVFASLKTGISLRISENEATGVVPLSETNS